MRWYSRMPTADRSHTERTRRVRALTQAARRAVCPSCPEEFPKPTEQSTWLSRRFGQALYFRQIASGVVVSESCCEQAAPSPPIPTCALCDASGDPLQIICDDAGFCPDSCCTQFTNATGRFAQLTLNTVSGVIFSVPVAPGETYPPVSLNKAIPNITGYSTLCDAGCLTPLDFISITDAGQNGPVTSSYIQNDFTFSVVVSLSNSAGDCTAVFIPVGGYICNVDGASQYAVALA
jgi:hypothetical protein